MQTQGTKDDGEDEATSRAREQIVVGRDVSERRVNRLGEEVTMLEREKEDLKNVSVVSFESIDSFWSSLKNCGTTSTKFQFVHQTRKSEETRVDEDILEEVSRETLRKVEHYNSDKDSDLSDMCRRVSSVVNSCSLVLALPANPLPRVVASLVHLTPPSVVDVDRVARANYMREWQATAKLRPIEARAHALIAPRWSPRLAARLCWDYIGIPIFVINTAYMK